MDAEKGKRPLLASGAAGSSVGKYGISTIIAGSVDRVFQADVSEISACICCEVMIPCGSTLISTTSSVPFINTLLGLCPVGLQVCAPLQGTCYLRHIPSSWSSFTFTSLSLKTLTEHFPIHVFPVSSLSPSICSKPQ